MTPKTRSGGKPPDSSVYHSTPSLQQVQFPTRRRMVRTYGKRQHQGPASTPGAKDPRQRTLTQIDFVSSSSLSEAATVVLNDGEEDDFAGTADDKENIGARGANAVDEEDDEPIPSGKRKSRQRSRPAAGQSRSKRRRTLGEDAGAQDNEHKTDRAKDGTRRKTLGDAPSSEYYTQTLTQLLGRGEDGLVLDSEDEAGDDGFDSWLQEPDSPSPHSQRSAFNTSPPKHPRREDQPATHAASRQSSVVPQTPAKHAIRFEIPSSSQLSTPLTEKMLDRYGPPDQDKPSPSLKTGMESAEPVVELPGKPKGTPRKLVIEDSFATESWEAMTPVKVTPLKDITAEVVGGERVSSSLTEMMSTPTRPKGRLESAELGDETPTRLGTRGASRTPTRRREQSPKPKKDVFEIPDSDEDDDDFDEEQFESGCESPRNRVERSQLDQDVTETSYSGKPRGHGKYTHPFQRKLLPREDDFVAGPETQFAMGELVSNVNHLPSKASPQQLDTSAANSSDTVCVQQNLSESSSLHPSTETELLPPQRQRPLRKPLRHLPPSSQTQPLESQRVPLSTIQGLGDPTNRTDILLPLPSSTVNLVASGHEVELYLPFKIPALVARFWLVTKDGLLRYGACAEAGVEEFRTSGRHWRYRLSQVYELNNPVNENEMREEGWVDGDIGRYIYLPPAGVGQLLANLRHALFGEHDAAMSDQGDASPEQYALERGSGSGARLGSASGPGSSMSESQQVEAQLRSDVAHHTQVSPWQDADDAILVPSTPLKDRTPKVSTTRKPLVHSSQATTASQPSTPDRRQSAPRTQQRQREPPCSTSRILPPPPPPTSQRRPEMPPQSSSSHAILPDMEEPSPSLLLCHSNQDVSLRSSQLLTKSQMLPDSLLRDDARVPPEIWDSDDDGR